MSGTSLLYDYVLSPMYDRLVRIWPAWVHPNAITALGGAACAGSIVLMEREAYGASCLSFTLYHMLDNMDGKHARRTRKSSWHGHVLDHALDGSFGIIASCRILCDHLFDFPAAKPFALRCAMSTLLTCHTAERCSGVATLGTRLFGADELFLTCSFALGWRAATGNSVLHLGTDGRTEDLWPWVQYGWVCAITTLAVLTVRHWTALLGLACFGTLCAMAPDALAPCIVYMPTLAFLLLANATRHKGRSE